MLPKYVILEKKKSRLLLGFKRAHLRIHSPSLRKQRFCRGIEWSFVANLFYTSPCVC
jgi:hypothetical protein